MLRVKNFLIKTEKYRFLFFSAGILAGSLGLSGCARPPFPNISAVPIMPRSLTLRQKQQTEAKLLQLRKFKPLTAEPTGTGNTPPVPVADLLKANPPALNLPLSPFLPQAPFFVFSPEIFQQKAGLPLKDRIGLLNFAFIAQNKPLILAIPERFPPSLLQKIRRTLLNSGFSRTLLQTKTFPPLTTPCLFIKSSASVKLCLRAGQNNRL